MWVTIITKLELAVVLAATVNCEHMKYDENFHTKIKVKDGKDSTTIKTYCILDWK